MRTISSFFGCILLEVCDNSNSKGARMENNKIIDEIDKVLKQDINMDLSCVSLYDVFNLI